MLRSLNGDVYKRQGIRPLQEGPRMTFRFPDVSLKKRALEETKINFLYEVILFAFRFCHSLMLIYGRLLIMTLGKAVLYVYKSLALGNPRLRKHLLERKKN